MTVKHELISRSISLFSIFAVILSAIFFFGTSLTEGQALGISPLLCNIEGKKNDLTVHPLTYSTDVCRLNKKSDNQDKSMLVTLTAYTSDPAETDSTPFITASNKTVRDGIIASNFLPFGTRVVIEGFGNKIFVVEDRMNSRFNDRIDIWMESKNEALSFGARKGEITILD